MTWRKLSPDGVTARALYGRMVARANPVIQLIEDNRSTLEDLCRRHRVRRLDIFGSAVEGDFDPSSSDLDFLVEFHELRDNEYADAYFGLLEDLKALFQRQVDLVVDSAVKNPYFRESIERSKTRLYAA